MGAWVDIFIRDYTEDPIDEGAFAINIEVQWPSPEVSYVRISFAEDFIEKLFHIRWNKDLGAEDKRLTKDRRDVFIQWGLFRLERWIEKREDVSKIMMTYEMDREWAEQVLAKKVKPQSEKVEEKHSLLAEIRRRRGRSTRLVKWIFGIFCLFLTAFGLGVRVHPENVLSRFHRENFGDYYQVEFFSGQKMAGQLVNETQDALEITIGGGTAVFKKNEIKSRHLLAAEDVKNGKYSDLILHTPHQDLPLVSVRYDDSLFFTIEKRISLLIDRAAAQFHKQSLAGEAQPAGDTKNENEFAMPRSLPPTVMPSSAVRGFSADNDQESDYTSLLKASLDQLKNSTK